MRAFDERWARCVRAARTAPRTTEAGAPDWLSVRRRLAAARDGWAEDAESMTWWRWYVRRGFALATALVVGGLLFAARDPGAGHPLRPGVENAVAEALWLL